MDLFARPNRKYLWIHLSVVGSIVFGQLIIPDFVEVWYIMIDRPQLIAAGALPCDRRPALSPEFVPRNCDLLLETITGPARQQQYTDTEGRETTTVVWESGHWSRTDTSHPVLMLSLILPALAFVALLFALRRPVAYLYAIPIIATGLLVPILRG